MTFKSYPWSTNGTGHGVSPSYGADRTQEVYKYALNVDASTGWLFEVVGLNSMAVTGGSGNVSVASGAAMVNGTIAINDAAVSIAMPTPVTATRIDRIILRWTLATQVVDAVRLAGTEGGGAPSLAVPGATYEVPLAQISTTTGGVITITADQRAWIRSSGLRGAVDAATLEWDTTNKYLRVKDGGITAAKLDQTSLTYPGLFTSTKTGVGTAAGVVVTSTVPSIAISDSGQGANEKTFEFYNNSKTLNIRAINDANSSATVAVAIARGSGTAIASIGLAATAINITGATAITGTLTVSGAITGALTGNASTATTATTATTANAVANDSVVNAGLANMATQTIKGRITAGTGDPEDLSVSQLVTLVNAGGSVASATTALRTNSSTTGVGTAAGVVVSSAVPEIAISDSAQGTDEKTFGLYVNTKTLNIRTVNDANSAAVTAIAIARGTGTAIASIGMAAANINITGATAITGTLSVSGTITGSVTGVTAGAVTNSGLASMADSTVKGRAVGAGTGAPTDLSAAQVAAIATAGGIVSGIPLTTRQGGSSSNWSTVGLSTQSTANSHMELGVIQVTLAAGTYAVGDIVSTTPNSITFPGGFSNLPWVMLMGAGYTFFTFGASSSTSTMTIGVTCQKAQTIPGGGFTHTIYWQAIGPN